jgi:hypothetical protein
MDSASNKSEPLLTLHELRMQIAQRRQAEQSIDGRPRVGDYDDDPLLDALKREHGITQKSD